jgi:hypothetical protein
MRTFPYIEWVRLTCKLRRQWMRVLLLTMGLALLRRGMGA